MTDPIRSRRAYAVLSCRVKACCSRGAEVTGADLVRIAKGLAVEPWHLVESLPAGDDDPTAISLGPGRQVRLRLPTTTSGCAFLWRTKFGAGRCGLGDLAPAACQVFPAEPRRAAPCVRSEPGCVCRQWTDDDLDPDELEEPVRAAHQELVEWYDAVSRWNAGQRQEDRDVELSEFLSRVMQPEQEAAS